MSKVVSTHLWNTPLNLYQQAINIQPSRNRIFGENVKDDVLGLQL